MRAAVVQFHSVGGRVERNAKSIERIIQENRDRIELFVFPELALSGYLDDARALEAAVSPGSEIFSGIRRATRGAGAVVGFVEQGEEENRIYNSAAYFQDGELIHVQRKISLVDYGKFKETDYFSPGTEIRCFPVGDFQAAILTCNDAWHPELAMIAALQGADLYIVPAAATFNGLAGYVENTQAWKQVKSHIAMLYGSYILFSNYCGARKNRSSFLGGSAIIDPHGDCIARVSANLKGIQSADIQKELVDRMRSVLPIAQNLRVDFMLRELQRLCREKIEKACGPDQESATRNP